MIDPMSFFKYLKVIWIKLLSNGILLNLFLVNFGGETIFSFHKKQLHKAAKCISNRFWKDIINNYALIKTAPTSINLF